MMKDDCRNEAGPQRDKTAAAPRINKPERRTLRPSGAFSKPTLTREDLRLMVPYGRWTCGDGREVLFNRDFEPVLQRYPGEPARAVDQYEWVNHVKEDFFQSLARTNAVLEEWGLPLMPPMPPAPRGRPALEDLLTSTADLQKMVLAPNPWIAILAKRGSRP